MRTKHVVGSGEMAGLTRDFNWEATPLGPIDGWSDLLLGSVNLMLCCRFPCAIFWGTEMLQFYNDDYMPLTAEKHPKALGQDARECWKEALHIVYKQAAHPTAVTGEAMFASVLAVYRGRLLNSGITVAERNRAEPPVACFEGEIRQVLSNLVGNAIDAMRVKGGRLLLRSRVAIAWMSGKQGLMLTVADSGTGINGRDAAKIFEAFFTTKGSAGNGLGLWVSHEIVDRHQGSLRMRSRQTPGGSGLHDKYLA